MIDQHMELLCEISPSLKAKKSVGQSSELSFLPYVHIGADEVFNLAACKNCSFFVEEACSNALYANFMRKVIKHVTKNYPDT